MSDTAGARFEQLVDIMRTLRSERGCAWDKQQTLLTLRPFVLQETYELLDALDHGDHESLKHELGDFLFEAVFLARICEEEGRFTIADSIKSIADKLVRRHPHIFEPDAAASLTPKQVKQQWEEIKARERTNAGESEKTVLSGVPRSMPSLLRAYELSTRAAQVGFDWVTTEDVIDKVDEEVRELRAAVAAGAGASRDAEEEFGDLLFSLVNVARKLGIEPEAALRIANDKFQRRFDDVERQVVADGKKFRDLTLEQLEELWQRAKTNAKGAKDTKDAKSHP
ncbi:MAG TPA: nucleoside triphosphate pyrophosphohydrolase [Vicinamibacterales bacterium]|nr:nucleoside triphosphate pyrophosphohydrolase [Vicinamibacterales bacterium]